MGITKGKHDAEKYTIKNKLRIKHHETFSNMNLFKLGEEKQKT